MSPTRKVPQVAPKAPGLPPTEPQAEPEQNPSVKQDLYNKQERIPEGEAQRMLQSLKRQAADGDLGPLQAYKKRTTQEGKREFYWDEFKLDKKCSKFSVKETKSVSHDASCESMPDWYTADAIAEFEGYQSHLPNYEELKNAAVVGLPSKPHPNKLWLTSASACAGMCMWSSRALITVQCARFAWIWCAMWHTRRLCGEPGIQLSSL